MFRPTCPNGCAHGSFRAPVAAGPCEIRRADAPARARRGRSDAPAAPTCRPSCATCAGGRSTSTSPVVRRRTPVVPGSRSMTRAGQPSPTVTAVGGNVTCTARPVAAGAHGMTTPSGPATAVDPSGRATSVPTTRLTPASAAVNGCTGSVSTSSGRPCSTTCPSCSTTTRSASVTASSTSCVTSTVAVRGAAHLLADQLAQLGGGAHVQLREGLVEQQHRRLGGERPGQGDALPLPAGQRVGAPVGQPAEPDRRQPLVGHRSGLRRRHPRRARTERDVLPRAQVREHQRVLAEQADGPVLGPHRRLHPAVPHRRQRPLPHAHHPGRGHEVPGQDGEQRGLARAVRTEHADDLPGMGRDRHVEREGPRRTATSACSDVTRHAPGARPARRAGPRPPRTPAAATARPRSPASPRLR